MLQDDSFEVHTKMARAPRKPKDDGKYSAYSLAFKKRVLDLKEKGM